MPVRGPIVRLPVNSGMVLCDTYQNSCMGFVRGVRNKLEILSAVAEILTSEILL